MNRWSIYKGRNFCFTLGIIFIVHIGVQFASTQAKTAVENPKSPDDQLLEIILKLRDKNIKESSPKEFAGVINRARILAEANTFSPNDATTPPKLYSQELLKALIDLLDWEQPRRTDSFDPSYGMPIYPAIYAIAAMRRAALPSMVAVIEGEDRKSLKSKNAIAVINEIFDRDDVKVVNYLREQSTISQTEKGKKNVLFVSEKILNEYQQREIYKAEHP